MKSAAYQEWHEVRTGRLEELFEVHKALDESGAGRHSSSERINWSLVLLLAAEFQGYTRDLHNEAGLIIAKLGSAGNAKFYSVLQARVTSGRQLDRGNANAWNLGNDFKILGLDLWADLRNRWPATSAEWNKNLTDVNTARNALAHSQASVIQSLRLTLDTVSEWRSSLDDLADRMDTVVAAHIIDMFGITDPWRQLGGTP